MSFNWKGAMRAMGQGISDTAGVMLSEEVQQMRDQRMQQYRQQERASEREYQGQVTADTRQYNEGLIQDERANQSQMATRQAEAAARAAEQERMTEERHRVEDREHDMAQIETRAKLDPRAMKINNTVNTGDQSDPRTEELHKAIGKADAEMFNETRTAVAAAGELEGALNVMEELSKSFGTGKQQEAIARVGQYFGTEEGAALQAWEGSASPIVLSKAKEMAGVLSDTDIKLLERAVPQFGNDPKANSIMFGILRKGIQRSRENHDAMQSHLNEFGNLNNFQFPHQQGLNSSRAAQSNIGAADDPLGLFQ